MGDVFKNIQNSTIINKSLVENSFNKVKSQYGEEVSSALAQIADFINKSNDPAAGVLFNSFNQEIEKPQPEKSKLKSFWEGIERSLPSIGTIAGAVAKISQTFM